MDHRPMGKLKTIKVPRRKQEKIGDILFFFFLSWDRKNFPFKNSTNTYKKNG